MARPKPLTQLSSFNSSKREVVFFNPSIAQSPAITPGLTPLPDSKDPRIPSSRSKRPWVVLPPPPAVLNKNLGLAESSSPCGWFERNSNERGLCAKALAILLCVVLFSVALGAYVVLIYLAVTTRRTKYIAFSCCLGGVFLLIACNVLASGKPNGEGHQGGRERTESEDDEEVLRAYGLR